MSSEKYSLSCLFAKYYTHLEALCSCHSSRRGELGHPSLAGAAFPAPPHPHTDLITPTPFPNLEACTKKAMCGEDGKWIFLPGPKCTPKSRSFWEGMAPEKGRSLRKASWSPSEAAQSNPYPFRRRMRHAHGTMSSIPPSSQLWGASRRGRGYRASQFCHWCDN